MEECDRSDFRHHVMYARTNNGWPVYATIEWKDGNLSICGVEGPKSDGDCKGSCGQVGVQPYHQPEVGFTDGRLEMFGKIWDVWHLNDMQAGTPKQLECLEAYRKKMGTAYMGYEAQCEVLKQRGLYEDEGYRYGTKWLKKEVPDHVVDFLRNLLQDNSAPEIWRKQ